MSEKKRVIPLDLLIDYNKGRYKAAHLAIKAVRNMVKDGHYNEIDQIYAKVAGFALKKVLLGEVEESVVKEED